MVIEVDLNYSIRITSDGLNVNTLLAELQKEAARCAREAFGQVVEQLEEHLLRQRPKGVQKSKKRERSFIAFFGEARYRAYDVRESGRYRCLVHEYLGIRSWQYLSDEIREQLLMLSVLMSFRKASGYFKGLISHGSLWRWVQKEGDKRREYFNGLEEAGLEYYEDAPSHTFAGIQADGINVRSQESGKKRHELKVAIAYSGHRERGYGQERELTDKALYISAEASEKFVERACLHFEKRLGVSRAKEKEIITDGAHWARGFKEHYPEAEYRLDLYHVNEAITRYGFGDKALGRALREALKRRDKAGAEDVFATESSRLKGGIEALRKSCVGLKRLEQGGFRYGIQRLGRKLESLEELRQYLMGNFSSIHYREEGSDKRVGSGAIERNEEITVGHRMKDRGMRWSIRGSENMGYLLAERTDGFKYSLDDLADYIEEAKAARQYEVRSGNGYEEIWNAPVPANQGVGAGKALQKLVRGINEVSLFWL